jgi:hypothetical protein
MSPEREHLGQNGVDADAGANGRLGRDRCPVLGGVGRNACNECYADGSWQNDEPRKHARPAGDREARGARVAAYHPVSERQSGPAPSM